MHKTLLLFATAASITAGAFAAASSAQASPLNGGRPPMHGGGYHGCGPACTPGGAFGHRPHNCGPTPWSCQLNHRPHGGGYGGGYWGGYRIYTRPVALYSGEDCEWVRVRTPYGPRWRNLCG